MLAAGFLFGCRMCTNVQGEKPFVRKVAFTHHRSKAWINFLNLTYDTVSFQQAVGCPVALF